MSYLIPTLSFSQCRKRSDSRLRLRRSFKCCWMWPLDLTFHYHAPFPSSDFNLTVHQRFTQRFGWVGTLVCLYNLQTLNTYLLLVTFGPPVFPRLLARLLLGPYKRVYHYLTSIFRGLQHERRQFPHEAYTIRLSSIVNYSPLLPLIEGVWIVLISTVGVSFA